MYIIYKLKRQKQKQTKNGENSIESVSSRMSNFGGHAIKNKILKKMKISNLGLYFCTVQLQIISCF